MRIFSITDASRHNIHNEWYIPWLEDGPNQKLTCKLPLLLLVIINSTATPMWGQGLTLIECQILSCPSHAVVRQWYQHHTMAKAFFTYMYTFLDYRFTSTSGIWFWFLICIKCLKWQQISQQCLWEHLQTQQSNEKTFKQNW